MIRNTPDTQRLCRWHYQLALETIECARDVNDEPVIRACATVLEGYRLARRVPRETVQLMMDFAEPEPLPCHPA